MRTPTVWLALAALLASVLVVPALGRASAVVADSSASQAARNAPIDVSGTWLSDRLRIRSSSCPAALTEVVRDEIRSGNLSCTFIVEQAGTRVHVLEICPDATIELVARVDPSGKLRRSERTSVDRNGCHWLFINTFSAALGRSPTTIQAMHVFQFDASCGVPDCTIELIGRLQRVELAARASSLQTRAAGRSRGHRSVAKGE